MRERITTLGLLATRSIWYRRYTALLLLFSLSMSTALLLAAERLRSELRTSFTNTVSGTDLLIGARSSPLQLLLYTVFHKGQATQNISWRTVQALQEHPKVAWAIPLSLGDSHKGFRVIGTDTRFFQHFKFGGKHSIGFSQGGPFSMPFDVVVGANVAESLKYRLEDRITIAHGLEDVAFSKHDKHPFRISGIMTRTSTPIDNAVIVSLESLEAIHAGYTASFLSSALQRGTNATLSPESVTALMLGLKSRAAIFQVQRWVNEFRAEPLLAVIPGVTLMELWNMLSLVEAAMMAVIGLVTLIGLISLTALMLATLNERRREMALLRALGARRADVILLILSEGICICTLAVLLGLGIVTLLCGVLGDWLEVAYGLALPMRVPSSTEWALMGIVIFAGVISSLWPAWRSYRLTLADGMTPR